jgi:hypothetical protein
MQIDHAIDALIIILQFHIILDGAQVIAQVLLPRRASPRKNATFLLHHASPAFQKTPHQFFNLLGISFALFFDLGKKELVIHAYFEPPTRRRGEADGLNFRLIQFDQVGCQADSQIGKPSNLAILDSDPVCAHFNSPLSRIITEDIE